MALSAEAKAVDAKHIAEKAVNQQSSHEILCSERYANINKQLEAIPKIYDTINDLRSVANKALGVWLGVAGVAVLLGIVYTVIKISHGG